MPVALVMAIVSGVGLAVALVVVEVVKVVDDATVVVDGGGHEVAAGACAPGQGLSWPTMIGVAGAWALGVPGT